MLYIALNINNINIAICKAPQLHNTLLYTWLSLSTWY